MNELLEKHQLLVANARNLRADLMAHSVLVDALLIAMTAKQRAAIAHNVQHLSENMLSNFLAQSQDPTDQALHALQRSMANLQERLARLPSS